MVKRLLYLNGLAALGAVLYHASGLGFIALIWWADRYQTILAPAFSKIGTVPYFGLRFVEQIVIFAIPAFVFVSGFFVAAATPRDQRTVSWAVIISRLRKLLIPYLVWSLLMIGLDVFQGKEMTLPKFVTAMLAGQAEPPYYYAPMITQLYLLAPFLVPLARNRVKLILILAGGIQVFFLLMRYPMVLGMDIPILNPFMAITRSHIFTSQIFWFVCGLSIGFHMAEFKAWIARYRKVFAFLAVTAFIAGFVEWELLLSISGLNWIAAQETLIDQIFSLGLLMTFLGFEQTSLPASSTLSQLGGKSYGVYLIHSPVLEYTSKLIYHFVPVLLGIQIIFQPILIAVGLAVPLIMMLVVNRSPVRRFYSYIFG